jgi:glutamyl-tRNA synthetase
MNTPAIVRFAPSPTGRMHIAGARTALYNYLLARQTGGRFILRIEDTDRKRLVPGAMEEIMTGLRWLGLEWDEGPDIGGPHGPYLQSEAKQLYQQAAQQLVEEGKAYPCFCSAERLAGVREERQKRRESTQYDGACRDIPPEEARRRVAAGDSHVIRFRTPKEGTTCVRDELRGEICVENRLIEDAILVKSDGLALYHLAAMVDDHRMEITHVLRGAEWLSSLPLHALILRAFQWQEPIWCHLSVFLKPSGKGKMSKRDGADLKLEGHSIFVTDLPDIGYIPEGIINWIALMGTSFDASEDVFSMADFIQRFQLGHLHPSPAAINFEKADHFNGVHIRRLHPIDLANRLRPFFEKANLTPNDALLESVARILQERITTLDDAIPMGGFFFREQVSPNPTELVAKGLTPFQSAHAAISAKEILATVAWDQIESAEVALRDLADHLGCKPGQLFGILRVAITGQTVSPPLFSSMEIIGREKVLARLDDAIGVLRSLSSPG